jgi:hypothetical protein
MSWVPQRSSESGNGGVLVETLLYSVYNIMTVLHNLSRQPYGRKILHVQQGFPHEVSSDHSLYCETSTEIRNTARGKDVLC